MNVLYASDDNYAPILSVSIASLCKQNKDVTDLNIYVISDGISIKNQDNLRRIVDGNNRKLTFLKKTHKHDLVDINLKLDRGSLTQYSRLFIQEILPDLDRVLYLDCDTLMVGKICDLYNVDLKGKVIGGILDAFSPWHYKALGLGSDDIYINSGVMLINLKRWREESIEDKFVQEIVKRKGKLLQGDQGLINTVLRGCVSMLPVRYDLMCYNYDFSYEEMQLYRRPVKYYSKQEIKEAKGNPAIIHFTSSFASMRPWQREDCVHPYAEEWRNLYRLNGYEIEGAEAKLTMKVYKVCPHKPVLLGLRVVHSFIKPLVWGIRYKVC